MTPGPSVYSDVAQGSAKALHTACLAKALLLGALLPWKFFQLTWFACLFRPVLSPWCQTASFLFNSHPPNFHPVLRILLIANKSLSSQVSQPSGKMQFQNKEVKSGWNKSIWSLLTFQNLSPFVVGLLAKFVHSPVCTLMISFTEYRKKQKKTAQPVWKYFMSQSLYSS